MTTIYWFSGTGNSLALAREIARTLEDARLVPIASLGPDPVTVDGDFGLVCPVYFYGLPLVVREFLARVDARSAPYAFCVLGAGGFPGWAATQARRLGRRAGKSFDAVHSVVMPGNYIAMYDVRGGDARERILGAARDDAKRIAAAVRNRTGRSQRGGSPLSALLYATFGGWFRRTCRGLDAKFVATDACTGCGACARVCPVRNIELVDGRPRWHHRCEQCFACIHWCPAAAIQIRGRPTAKRERYHHPEVSLEDMASQPRQAP
jgi:ferredoxin